MHGNSAGTYQFFTSEDLIVYGIYIIQEHRNKRLTYIDGNEMNLRMAMLSGLRGRHVHNLAGTA
jgi:hypothetical protein